MTLTVGGRRGIAPGTMTADKTPYFEYVWAANMLDALAKKAFLSSVRQVEPR